MKQRFKNASIIGKLMILIGLLVIAPISILPWYPQDAAYIPCFLLPGGFSVVLGFIICLLKIRRKHQE